MLKRAAENVGLGFRVLDIRNCLEFGIWILEFNAEDSKSGGER